MVTRYGRTFHTLCATSEGSYRLAMIAWDRQDASSRAWAEGLGLPLSEILVTRQDALASGACIPGVDAYIARHGLDPDAAVPAEALLALPDHEIQRVRCAIVAAARRIRESVAA